MALRTPFSRPRLGLALGGGAARGLAHLGVLQVFEQEELGPDAVAGTSIGALFGGLWAALGDATEAERRVTAFVNSDEYRSDRVEFLKGDADEPSWGELLSERIRRGIVLGWTFFRESFVSEEEVRHNVESLLPDLQIEELAVPFCAVATDLLSRRSVFLRHGSLREAALASGAVPALMPPRRLNDWQLVDGAVTEKVPARALIRAGVDIIVGVDVSPEVFEEPELESGAGILARSKQITEWQLRRSRLALCDLVIRPDVAGVHWADFSGALPAIERGREAARAALPELRRLLRSERWTGWLGGRRRHRRWVESSGALGDAALEA